jgi:hypothetical protein
LSTFAKPIIDFVIPFTVPVKVGLLIGAYDDKLDVVAYDDKLDVSAFKSNAVCVAVDIGFDKSAVLSTFAKPIIDFVIPLTDPVNVGLLIGAYDDNELESAFELIFVFIVSNVDFNVPALYDTYDEFNKFESLNKSCFEFVRPLIDVVILFIDVVCDSSDVCKADTLFDIVDNCVDNELEISTYDKADVPKFTEDIGNLFDESIISILPFIKLD